MKKIAGNDSISTYDSSLSNYFTGMSLMASSMIKTPSYVTVDVYKKDGKSNSNYTKSQYTLNEVLNAFFYERKDIIDTVSYMMEHKLGKPVNIFELTKKEFDEVENDSVYYILDDAYVIEYEKYIVYLMIGNNE